MSRPDQAVSYAAVLRIPGVPRAFAAATLARLSYGTVSLSLLLTVHTATGSFGVAGVAIGAYGIAAVLAPLKSRGIDRYGRRRVLTPLALGYAAALFLIAALATGAVSAAVPYVGLAGAAGVLTPPVGPVMRGIWASLAPDSTSRQRAYALDAVVEEAVFTVSPLLVAVVVATARPLIALVLTAVFALVGMLGLAMASLVEPASAQPVDTRRRFLGPLASGSLRWVLFVMLTVGVGLSLLELGVVARATQTGRPATAGYLLGALSLGSVVGGLLWGRRLHPRTHTAQIQGLLPVLAGGAVLSALVEPLPAFGAVLCLTGLAVAPIYVVAYLAADRLTAPDVRTEATTWVATASNLGAAAGAGIGGYLIDQTSARTALLSAGAGLALASLALAALHVLGRAIQKEGPVDRDL